MSLALHVEGEAQRAKEAQTSAAEAAAEADAILVLDTVRSLKASSVAARDELYRCDEAVGADRNSYSEADKLVTAVLAATSVDMFAGAVVVGMEADFDTVVAAATEEVEADESVANAVVVLANNSRSSEALVALAAADTQAPDKPSFAANFSPVGAPVAQVVEPALSAVP